LAFFLYLFPYSPPPYKEQCLESKKIVSFVRDKNLVKKELSLAPNIHDWYNLRTSEK
jgi:hypothetical protein